ncbi:unnamed protein product [Linum tenue]|uniref:Uncharacterized protein n=1 Tax=Linum tenue TaxID=586396 RepID=A0AAV0N0L2_9ROSI|nr:unnamed protein product [Linum tenue]
MTWNRRSYFGKKMPRLSTWGIHIRHQFLIFLLLPAILLPLLHFWTSRTIAEYHSLKIDSLH